MASDAALKSAYIYSYAFAYGTLTMITPSYFRSLFFSQTQNSFYKHGRRARCLKFVKPESETASIAVE